MAGAVRRSPVARVVGVIAAVVAASALLSACQPDPAATPTMSATSSPTATSHPSPSSTATPTASATNPPDAGFALPAKCEDIYSATMLAALNAANPPLNDPGVTMHSTQNADALELLTSGIPTIRCSWGQPSEYGLSTNVSVVDAGQSASILSTLRAAGFSCDDVSEGTLCTTEQKVIDQDDNEVTLGESHFLRGVGWVSTAWVNFAPDGYTQDIIATLWG